MPPTGALCVVPSRLTVGESFAVKLKLLGPVRVIEASGAWNTRKPSLRGPFNRNVQRGIQYHDNALPEWSGSLQVIPDDALEGPAQLDFNGRDQGVFPGDRRPIAVFPDFRWTQPGFHFLRFVEPESGLEVLANPTFVCEHPPSLRVYWGDPHWQTFFTDGVRCPEELYAFARDEGFLDFGAISDHMEGVTDRQWDYFQAVTNDFNQPGAFVTLQGQEWTNHNPDVGAPGHRNIYYRGDGGPVLRSNDPQCDTLEKLWRRLDELRPIDSLAIPHHPANVVMGVDWEQGWNPRYERAVEVYSVWGSSERPEVDGNPIPIRALQGEQPGRHVVDALRKGYRLGFVGGGDIHDGRPGDDLHDESYPPRDYRMPRQGLTAVWTPELTRQQVFDAVRDRRTYAATRSRIYLEVMPTRRGDAIQLEVRAASEEGVQSVVLVMDGCDAEARHPDTDPRVVTARFDWKPGHETECVYIRVLTCGGNMAWSSPVWRDEL